VERAADIEIYLEISASEEAPARLSAALSACRAAAVLIRGATDVTHVKPLVEATQKAGAAAIVADDARLARTTRADGVHLSWSDNLEDRYAEAREILGRQGIVGVEAGPSRHDAMTLAEAGAEYVALGASLTAEAQRDMVAWWAEIFEIPGVALGVESAEAAGVLAAAGADFIGIPVRAGRSSEDIAAAVRAYLKAIRAAENEIAERTP